MIFFDDLKYQKENNHRKISLFINDFALLLILSFVYLNWNYVPTFYNTIHPTIPVGSEAVNFFNYPYLAASIEYYQRESYLKKRKET